MPDKAGRRCRERSRFYAGRGYVSFSGTTVSARQPEGVPRAAVGLMHGRGYVSFSEATVKAE